MLLTYTFGPFTLSMPAMDLRHAGTPVKLGGRALRLVAALAEARGELIERNRLLENVWGKQAIDESALRVHLSSARKVLDPIAGQPTIVNEAGRGYRLTLPVTMQTPTAAVDLPLRLTSIVGRDAAIEELSLALAEHKLLTIAGAGGIGKTTVALEVARRVASLQNLPPVLVELASLNDPDHVASSTAAALGAVPDGDDMAQIVQALSTTPRLLVLDNGEHVLDAVADMVEAIMRRVPNQIILLTSREPMRVGGEWVYRLPPLDLPEGAADAFSSPACRLFVERAGAVRNGFAMTEENAAPIADICRNLDGLPLAIELAAGRSDIMTPEDIASALDDRFDLLTRGRRNTLPRHQTLRAVLDWSYGLLEEDGRRILDRLSIFQGAFRLEDAVALTGVTRHRLRDILHDLVAKSLIVSGDHGYRLLETTRHYGLQRLADTGVLQDTRVRQPLHVTLLLTIMEDAVSAWDGGAQREWLTHKARYLSDMRAALDWAETGAGDVTLTLRLLISGAPLWFHLSLASEYLARAERALSLCGDDQAEELLVELLNGYGHALWHVRGPTSAMGDAFARALSLAKRMENEPLILRSLWGVWAQAILAGNYAESLHHAEAFAARLPAESMLSNRQTSDHMLALSHHFLGHHARSLELLEALMRIDATPERENHANHAQVDGSVAAMSLLMRLQWMMGDLPAALELARHCAAHALELDHSLSVSYGLAVGCIPVALAAGDHALAESLLEELHRHTGRHGLHHWRIFVDGYRGHPTPSASVMQQEMFAVAQGAGAKVPWFAVPPA